MDFTGWSAFPPAPDSAGVDERAFRGVIERLVTAGVDSTGALGSTGHYALRLAQAGLAGDAAAARVQSAVLEPLWTLFAEYGSARVVAAVAQELGLAHSDFLPRRSTPPHEAGCFAGTFRDACRRLALAPASGLT